MANNRMNIRCNGCGEEFCIAKRYEGPYFQSHVFTIEALEAFFEKHYTCDSDLPPFSLTYEEETIY